MFKKKRKKRNLKRKHYPSDSFSELSISGALPKERVNSTAIIVDLTRIDPAKMEPFTAKWPDKSEMKEIERLSPEEKKARIKKIVDEWKKSTEGM